MEFIISDTCIFIDLFEVGLLKEFFDLPFRFYTTDFVINEIKNPGHLLIIKDFINLNKLEVFHASPNQVYEIAQISGEHPKLSTADCSVFYFGKVKNLIVLTNDKRLRRLSKDIGVHGILWIFDCLLLKGIISKSRAVEKLRQLIRLNQRLPMKECMRRIKEWGG